MDRRWHHCAHARRPLLLLAGLTDPMQLSGAPAVDVRGPITAQRGRLLSLLISAEAARRLLTGARYDLAQVRLSGDRALAEPLLRVRGTIVQPRHPAMIITAERDGVFNPKLKA